MRIIAAMPDAEAGSASAELSAAAQTPGGSGASGAIMGYRAEAYFLPPTPPLCKRNGACTAHRISHFRIGYSVRSIGRFLRDTIPDTRDCTTRATRHTYRGYGTYSNLQLYTAELRGRAHDDRAYSTPQPVVHIYMGDPEQSI